MHLPSQYKSIYRHNARRSLARIVITPTDAPHAAPPPIRSDFITPSDRPKPAAARFFVDTLPDHPDARVALPDDQARHATRVLRLTQGSEIELLDGKGKRAAATLELDTPDQPRCRITAIQTVPPLKPSIQLATAIPKGPRGDAMVNELAQLGVDTLIPLITRRSVVDPGPNKIDRYRKAAIAASKQSHRPWLMQVYEKAPFTEVIDCDASLKLIADPLAAPIPDLDQRVQSVKTVRVLVGPEGGWHPDEAQQARDAGFIPWRFSPNTLRIETAAAAAVAILRRDA